MSLGFRILTRQRKVDAETVGSSGRSRRLRQRCHVTDGRRRRRLRPYHAGEASPAPFDSAGTSRR